MDVMYDAILGKLREGGDDSGGGGQYVKQMEYVTVVGGASIQTITLMGGTHVELLAPVEVLDIASVENSHDESEVVVTGDTVGFTVNIPASVSIIGSPTFEAGKSYVINVRDNMLVAAEYTPGATE